MGIITDWEKISIDIQLIFPPASISYTLLRSRTVENSQVKVKKISSAQATTAKISKWDYIVIKFLHSKGNSPPAKLYRVGENICKPYIR